MCSKDFQEALGGNNKEVLDSRNVVSTGMNSVCDLVGMVSASMTKLVPASVWSESIVCVTGRESGISQIQEDQHTNWSQLSETTTSKVQKLGFKRYWYWIIGN